MSICAALLVGPAAEGAVYRGPIVKVGGRFGPDLVAELPFACCYEVPIPPGCPFPGCDWCLGDEQTPPRCDDEPKFQREPSLAVAWWNPNLLLATFIDWSDSGLSLTKQYQNGFAISRDGGATWRRLKQDPLGWEDPPASEGFMRNRDHAVAPPDGWLPDLDGDPGTAIGGDSTTGVAYLYFTGAGPYLVRLRLSFTEPILPLLYPEGALMPDVAGYTGGDKPFVSTNASGEQVYVHWAGKAPHVDPPAPAAATLLTVSCAHGDEFFADPATGCQHPSLPHNGASIQLSYLMHISGGGPDANWGSTSAVGPDGTVHFLWPVRQYYPAEDPPGDPHVRDQVFLRSLHPPGQQWVFDPPLPPTGDTECVDDGPGGQTDTCEVPIVFGHPGMIGPGYLGPHGAPASAPLNFTNLLTHAVIAVDGSAPSVCGRSGYTYAVYCAAEPLEYTQGVVEPCPRGQQCLDTNIYIVRSVDYGKHWGAPVRVNALGEAPPDPELEFICGSDPPPPCSPDTAGYTYRPLQFYPWVAVDQQGRVGVVYYETWPDHILPDGDPCDGNVRFCVTFAYSLDGGVSWEWRYACLASLSQTGIGEGDPETGWDYDCRQGFDIRDYIGLTATSGPGEQGVFYPIWSDLSEYGEYWRRHEDPNPDPAIWAPFMGDPYTASITIDDPVFSLGDYDRDGDVDSTDLLAYGNVCATSPLPPLCEIMDINRNNVMDNQDPTLLMENCYTGPLGGGGGESGGESAGAGKLGIDGIAGGPEFVAWCVASMSAEERTRLADLMRAQAASVDAAEGKCLEVVADAITP